MKDFFKLVVVSFAAGFLVFTFLGVIKDVAKSFDSPNRQEENVSVVCGKVTEKYSEEYGFYVVVDKKLYRIFRQNGALFATMEIGLTYTFIVENEPNRNTIVNVLRQGD